MEGLEQRWVTAFRAELPSVGCSGWGRTRRRWKLLERFWGELRAWARAAALGGRNLEPGYILKVEESGFPDGAGTQTRGRGLGGFEGLGLGH